MTRYDIWAALDTVAQAALIGGAVWNTEDDNGDPVSGGRWIFDTTPLQVKVSP